MLFNTHDTNTDKLNNSCKSCFVLLHVLGSQFIVVSCFKLFSIIKLPQRIK